jgi:hypothetical protein
MNAFTGEVAEINRSEIEDLLSPAVLRRKIRKFLPLALKFIVRSPSLRVVLSRKFASQWHCLRDNL